MSYPIGPRIVRDESLMNYIETQRAEDRPRTGIRRGNTGAWAAIKNGRLVESFSGPGSKAAAIRVAGTNTEVA